MQAIQDTLNRFKEWDVIIESFKQEENALNEMTNYVVTLELTMKRRQFDKHLYDMLVQEEGINIMEMN